MPPDEQDPDPGDSTVLGYLSSLSNWGRWGPEDELGTLNFLDAHRRTHAATLVRTGQTIACGRPISPSTGTASEPVLHMMIGTGSEMPEQGAGAAGDWFGLFIHGYTVTHIDAHSHNAWDRKLYNGRDAYAGVTAAGARVGGLEPIANGIVGRGVLLDFPGSVGKAIPAGTELHLSDVLECAERQGTAVHPGDIVLLRFGGGRAQQTDVAAARALSGSGPLLTGLAPDCLPWIHRSEVAVLGSDAVSDVMPPKTVTVPMPIHVVGIVAMGLWVIDNLDLESLAAACAAEQRWEFFFVVAPLVLRRATGCPVNPIAVF